MTLDMSVLFRNASGENVVLNKTGLVISGERKGRVKVVKSKR